jgi:hypothetical protein
MGLIPGFSPPVWAGEIPVRRLKKNNIVRPFFIHSK